MLAKGMAYFGNSTGAIIGHAIDNDSSPPHAVAFITNFFEVLPFDEASAALNGALDIVFGHVGCRCLVEREAQTGIGFGLGAPVTCCNLDLANNASPYFSPLGVLTPFAVLNIRPFTMTCYN